MRTAQCSPTPHKVWTVKLTPLIAFHMGSVTTAMAVGPWRFETGAVAMVCTALSALFIRDFKLPNLAGFTPIHLLIPLTLVGLFSAF